MLSNEVKQELKQGPILFTEAQVRGMRHSCGSIWVSGNLYWKGGHCVCLGQSWQLLWSVRASEGCPVVRLLLSPSGVTKGNPVTFRRKDWHVGIARLFRPVERTWEHGSGKASQLFTSNVIPPTPNGAALPSLCPFQTSRKPLIFKSYSRWWTLKYFFHQERTKKRNKEISKNVISTDWPWNLLI